MSESTPSEPPSAAASSGDTSPSADEEDSPSGGQPGAEGEHTGAGAKAKVAGAAALTLGALGVVFGDIGTSPLYAMHAVFELGVPPDQPSVYGVISLVFWSITVIVSLKYVTFIMRADNDGEGGIMALISLVQSISLKGKFAKVTLVALGIFGASLFYGDGMITPAISVLSAVEGLEVAAPSLAAYVVPIALVVLAVLFGVQRYGTHAVGRLFGPVMALWFGTLAISGLAQVIQQPGVLSALSPTYGVAFLVNQGTVAFLALGAVVLAVTGAEALYADMGHFGRRPIRRAWFLLVFPALTLNYLGQAALILTTPGALANPLFLLFPGWALIPVVLLATAAAVIASQAVISGAFSVTRQAVQLGFLPRLTIRHTSQREIGQVYAPAINWGIFLAVVGLVVGFGTSTGLSAAYGIAVTGTLAIDTILFFVVVRAGWRKPLWLVLLGAAVFLTVDLAFLGANLTKVASGGWFPLLIAAVVFVLLTTWQRGRDIVTRRRNAEEGPLLEFVEEVRVMDPPVHRVSGTAVFLNSKIDTTPLALRAIVEHNHTMHESVVILSIETLKVPFAPEGERIVIDDLGFTDDGISHVTARFGFQDDHDVPETLALCAAAGLESEVDVEGASYFLSQISVVPRGRSGMRKWRKRLFATMSRNSASPVDYFGLPVDRTVVVGARIEF